MKKILQGWFISLRNIKPSVCMQSWNMRELTLHKYLACIWCILKCEKNHVVNLDSQSNKSKDLTNLQISEWIYTERKDDGEKNIFFHIINKFSLKRSQNFWSEFSWKNFFYHARKRSTKKNKREWVRNFSVLILIVISSHCVCTCVCLPLLKESEEIKAYGYVHGFDCNFMFP